jgi:hypothetical protein
MLGRGSIRKRGLEVSGYVSERLEKSRNLTLDPRDQLPELADRAASTNARVDGVAAGAQPAVLRLEIEIPVEIERRAVFIELRPDSSATGEHEVDMFGPREEGTANAFDRNAFGARSLGPFDLGDHRPRLQRNAPDDRLLDNHARDSRRRGAGLRREYREQHGPKPEDRSWSQRCPTICEAASQPCVE